MSGPYIIILLAILLVSSQLLNRCSAARYHCENDAIKRIDISSEAGQEEKMVPKIDAPSFPADGIRCKWEISAHEKDSALLILTSFDANEPSQRRTIRSISGGDSSVLKVNYQLVAIRGPEGELRECSTSHDEDTVADNMFRVMLLPKRGHLSVTYQQQQQQNSIAANAKLMGLRVILVEQEFCTREMTSFDRRCFTASPLERSLKLELGSLNGDSKILRLASFRSMEEIQGFVEASKQRVAIIGEEMAMRSKVPLDLSQPLWIGLFYDAKSGSLKFLDVQEGQCSLKLVEDPVLLNSTRPQVNGRSACGSLRVTARGQVAIEFNDCSQKLRALISFDETPQKGHCTNCTRAVVQWLLDADDADSSDRIGQSPQEAASTSFILMVSSTAAAALVLIVVAVVVATFCVRSRSRRDFSRRELAAATEKPFLADGGKSHEFCHHADDCQEVPVKAISQVCNDRPQLVQLPASLNYELA